MVAAAPLESGGFKVRFIGLDEGERMRELFVSSFKLTMSVALWNWKYRQGESRCVGVFHGDELIAHYGTIDAPISYRGRPARALQVVDVMVTPAYRRAVRKETSPFYLAGHYCAEHSVGYDRPFLLGYGFPSDRHMQLAQHLDLYEPVGRMFEVLWPLPAVLPKQSLVHRLRRIDGRQDKNAQGGEAGLPGSAADPVDAAQRRQIDVLWAGMQQDLRDHIVVQKDAAWVQRRYLSHPERQYALYLLQQRVTGRPLGLIVLKEDGERLQLMDYIGPLRNLPALLLCALRLTRAAGKQQLYTWCSETFVPRFSCHGGTAHPLEITTPATTRMPGPTAAELRDRWWLLPGDTDFL